MCKNVLTINIIYYISCFFNFYIELCVNNTEVTVNTYTYIDVFTITTTKDQLDGTYVIDNAWYPGIYDHNHPTLRAGPEAKGGCCNP